MERKLNVDIPKSISEFEILIDEILPRKNLYKIVLRGKGLDFDGYKNFSPDDDASIIDWKASIRSNMLLSRQYIEEREHNVIFVIDMGENMVFGSQEKLKCEYVVELAAAFSHKLIKTRNNIGFILFNKDVFNFVRPGAGKEYDIFISELLNPENYKESYNFSHIINDINNILNFPIDLIIFISDFLGVREEHKDGFNDLGFLYETIAISVKDLIDVMLPDIDEEIVIEDYRTREKLLINPKIARRVYEENALEQIKLTRKIFQESNIDLLEVYTHQDFKPILSNFLKNRIDKRFI